MTLQEFADKARYHAKAARREMELNRLHPERKRGLSDEDEIYNAMKLLLRDCCPEYRCAQFEAQMAYLEASAATA